MVECFGHDRRTVPRSTGDDFDGFCYGLEHGVDSRISCGHEPGPDADVAFVRFFFPSSSVGVGIGVWTTSPSLGDALQSVNLFGCAATGIIVRVA